ncbi:MAG: hypothetical protein L6265_00345 [Thermoplasmatales archaeon]|nr:hypothetical protein [Thermoplasmatales archaeon]
MKKILLIYTYMSPFIKKDLEILKENFDVKTFHYETSGAILRIRQLSNAIPLAIQRNVKHSFYLKGSSASFVKLKLAASLR